eukprot:gene17904-biopygen7277
MGDEERSAKVQAKGWSGEGQRSVAAVAEKRSDGCDEADNGSDGVQDAMTDEDARTRLFRGRRRRQRKPYTELPSPLLGFSEGAGLGAHPPAAGAPMAPRARTARRRWRRDPPRTCSARRRHCWGSWNQLKRVPVPRMPNELTWPNDHFHF